MKYIFRLTAFILCVSMLLCLWPAMAVMGRDTDTVLSATDFDEKRAVTAPILSTAMTASLSPAELLSYLLGQPLTREEKVWLEADGGQGLPPSLSLTYDSAVPHESVSVSFDEQGIPTVTAVAYTGLEIGTHWIPTSVRYEDQLYPLTLDEQGTYTARLTEADSALVTVTVNYQATLSPSLADANTLLNLAYHRGYEILQAYEAYEATSKAHTEATAVYREAMKQYREDLALYQAYEADRKLYESRLSAYKDYLAALKDYESQLDAYHAYLEEKAVYDKAYAEYTDFIANPSAYEEKYLAYCAYVSDMEKVRLQLTYMDSCFIGDTAGNVLHGTLNGPTVATVVARQDELVSVGCDARDIANADTATAALIALLNAYPNEGTDTERYAYYIRHYTAFRDNVTLLYTSLSRLYTNDTVPDILQMQGKKERYWQFVAQLYALSCALEDGIAFDINWHIAEGQLTDLLDDCFILTDANTAAPLAVYPAEVEEVTPPSDVKKPTEPTTVSKPVEPTKVSEPTPPQEVTKPTLPQSPGTAPVKPLYSTVEDALYEAVKSKSLLPRAELERVSPYDLTVKVGVAASYSTTPIANFYDSDGITLLYSTLADEEGRILMPTEAPTRPSQSGYAYTFSGWVDDTGKAYALNAEQATILQSTCFYAVYATEKEHYTITWDVDGIITEDVCAFGEIPVFDGIPEKTADETYVYEFVGWTPAVTPVSGSAAYTAVFAAHRRVYTVEWHIGTMTETESYDAGEMPAYAALPALPLDGRYRYIFKGWTPAVTPVVEDTAYTAIFEAVDLTEGVPYATVTEDDTSVTVIHQADADQWRIPLRHVISYAAEKNSGLTLSKGIFTLFFDSEAVFMLNAREAAYVGLEVNDKQELLISLTDINGRELSAEVVVRFTATLVEGYAGRLTDQEGTVLSSASNGESTLVARLNVHTPYKLYQGYRIRTELTVSDQVSDTGGLCVPHIDLVGVGEEVTVTVTPAPGYGINRIVVRDVWGAVLPTTDLGDGVYRFIMPEGDVSVTADFIHLQYTVTFMCDGQLISSAVYRYGEMPNVPDAPTRESDSEFSYSFTGWTPTVTAVMKNMTYEATFLAVPLDDRDSVEDSGIGILELFIIGFGAFCVSCTGILVPYIIVSRKKQAATNEDINS